MNGRSSSIPPEHPGWGGVQRFISDESSRASSSRRWRSSEEFQTTAEFERHDRRIAKYRDRNWGKVFTLSVIKAPKIDSYGPWLQGRLPEELGPWVGLPEGAAGIDEEPRICTEEGCECQPEQSLALDDLWVNPQ